MPTSVPCCHPRRPRSVRGILVLLLGFLLAGSLCAEDWPQFRGPQGRAVSTDVRLPSDLGPESPALRWKVPVPGTGVSSPVVSGGRVFLTAAYQGEERSKVQGRARKAAFVLAGLAFLGLVLGWFVGRRRDDAAPARPGWPVRALCLLDGLGILLGSLVFMGLAVAVVLRPERLWTPGLPGDAWLMTGTIGLTGLVVAFGAFHPRSVIRLLGVVVLPVAAYLLLQHLPLNKHREVYKLTYRMVLVAPGIGGALWFLLLFLVVRKRHGIRTTRLALLAGPSLAALAAVPFAMHNFLNPEAGLVRALLCLDLETGETLWNTPLLVAPEERLHRQNSFATPTPCADGERVFAYFGPGYACLDYAGNVLWEGRDETYVENSRYGCVSSPIWFEDLVIINQESEQELRPSYLYALDRDTGAERWRVQPEFAKDSYMTPSIVPVGDTVQLVTVSMAKAAAYDPRTGAELWTMDLPTWQHAPSLTWKDDLLYVSGGAHVKSITAALRLTGTGRGVPPQIVWKSTRNVPKSSSPVLYEDVYVMGTSGGILQCFDPHTGKTHWRKRIEGSVLASPVGADGKVLFCTEEGDVLVIEARPEYREVSTANLGETIRATPALADGRVLIRTDAHLYCFEG